MSLFRVPAGMLSRARWIFYLACLANAVGLGLVALLDEHASPARAGAELLALLGLTLWCGRSFPRRDASLVLTFLASAALFACTRLHPDRLALVGFVYTSVGLVSLEKSFKRVALRSAMLSVGYAAGLFDHRVAAWLIDLRSLAGVPLTIASLYTLAVVLARLEQSVAIEDALAEVSAALVAAKDRETVQRAAVDGCLALMGGGSTRVSLWLKSDAVMTLAALAGDGSPVLVGTQLPLDTLPVRRREGVFPTGFTLSDAELDGLRSVLPFTATASDVRVSPLLAKGELLGVLVVRSDGPLARESARILGAFARQVALALESAQLMEHLRASEARFRSIVQNTSDIITLIDADGRVLYATPSAEALFGRPASEILGEPLCLSVSPEDQTAVEDFIVRGRTSGRERVRGEYRIRRPDGSLRYVETHATNLLDDPSVRGLVLVTRDTTDRKALETRLEHQAFHDPLTGLANRALFRNRLEHALVRSSRGRTPVAVLFVDLDDFKAVNDCFGHAAGDQALLKTAERLQLCLREADTAARLGGDEFAVLLEGSPEIDDVTMVAERILAALSAPISVQGRDLVVSASMGVAFSAAGAEGAEDLLASADLAMYQAKQRGKNCFELSDPEVRARVLKRLELEGDLRRAVDGNELRVLYLPTVALATGQIVGVEALLRWQHPRRGLVMPSEFIPAAEATGAIHPLGKWVLAEACAQGQRWREEYPQVPLTVSVNLSPRQLQRAGFVDEVAAVLARSGFDPRQLVLELTESVVLEDTETMIERLHLLKALGVRLAIDDFGTGYSSLSSLPKLPIDYIKIDKPFVDSIGGLKSSPLAFAITTLGQIFNLEVVAEGIERAEQVGGLRALGCEQGQGYYFSEPVDAAGISALLREPRGLVSRPPSGSWRTRTA